MGRPSKELYSVAGLLLIKEFMDWTNERAAYCYTFDVSNQDALNLQPQQQSMCDRTVVGPTRLASALRMWLDDRGTIRSIASLRVQCPGCQYARMERLSLRRHRFKGFPSSLFGDK